MTKTTQAHTTPTIATARDEPIVIATPITRLFTMLYDGMLILAMLFLTGTVLSVIGTLIFVDVGTTIEDAKALPEWYQNGVMTPAFVLTLVGFYGVFWRKSGQTLGMQTWRLKTVTSEGKLLTWGDSFKRIISACVLPIVFVVVGTLNVTGPTNLNGGLTVTGNTQVANLTATGDTSLNKVDVTGELNVAGKTTVTELEATGKVTLKDTLTVEGKAQLKNTLVVDEQATFKKGVTLGDAVTGPQIVRNGDNIKVQQNNGDPAKITNIADGTENGDAVNLKQVNEKIQQITAGGLKFEGDDQDTVHRNLSTKLTITGGANKDQLSENNIGVVKNPNNQGLIVKLAKSLTGLDSVTTNALTVNGGPTNLTGPLNVTGNTTLTGNLEVTGDTSLQKTTVNQDLEVKGTTKVTSLEATGKVTLKDTLTVEGKAQLKNTLVVDGQATFKDGVTLGNAGGPKIVNDGADVIKVQKNNGDAARITNVADGTNPSDAVNKQQVDAKIQEITDKGLKFKGDDGLEVHRDLGEELKIIGGQTDQAQLTDNNIGVVKDGEGLKVKLAKSLTGLDSVTTEALSVNNGATIGGTLNVTGPTNLNGGLTVTGLEASGEVHFKDILKVDGETQLNNTLVVNKQATFKDGVTLGNAGGPKIVNDGADVIKVQKNNGDAARITNVADGTNPSDAVNKQQLDAQETKLIEKGLTFVGDDEDEVHRKLGDTLKIVGEADKNNLTDGNIGVLKHGTDGLVVKLAKNLQNLESVATNTLTTTGRTTAGNGLTVQAGPTNLNGGLTVTGDTTVQKLTAGDTQVANLTATGNTSLQKVDITGALMHGSRLAILLSAFFGLLFNYIFCWFNRRGLAVHDILSNTMTLRVPKFEHEGIFASLRKKKPKTDK
ncbi:RDD family protein [Moraxella sp. ZY200743]|uniref:RDD family protein n=1 Tax=Moraxella sp. ZY200743 TaxID=2911970 RepID=UPI003D7E9CFD